MTTIVKNFGFFALALALPALHAQSALDTALPPELRVQAEREGKVVVYSFTSRIAKVEEAFERVYPGIDVEGIQLSSEKQLAQIQAEAQSGRVAADVVYVSDAAGAVDELLTTKIVTAYVPPRVAGLLDEENKTPLLSHRLSTKVLMYNEEANPVLSPIDNLWELTTPQWKGRVVMVNPLKRGDYLDLMTEFVLRSDVMASAYQAQFRKKIDLRGARNAGERFIMDLYANGVVLVDSTEEVNERVGRMGQENPPVGFTSYSDLRDNAEKGWALQVSNGTSPSAGIAFPAVLAVTSQAQHPAAARLLIDFMMGDESNTGGEGYKPFYVPGDYAVRRDIVTHPDAMPLPNLGAWRTDPVKTAQERDRVQALLSTLPVGQ